LTALPILTGYPDELVAPATALIESGKALEMVATRYPERHRISSNRELFTYVQELKMRHLKHTPQLVKVQFDKRLRSAHNALGLHVTKQRVHGGQLRKSRELRVASLFREAPAAFLRMIVVHELAHQKYAEHDRDFYRLCSHMEPDYPQLEFDLRIYLSALDHAAPAPEPKPASDPKP
jgi:predicted metal-dependent hydrolase